MTPGRRSITRRIAYLAAFTIAGLVVVCILLWVFRWSLLGRLVADRAATGLSEGLGGRFTVESAEGGILNDITLVGIRAVDPPDPGLPKLAIGRLRITYPFLGFLRDDFVARIRSIEASGIDVELDLTRPRPGPSKPFLISSVPLELPRIDVDGTIAARLPEGTFRAGRIELRGDGKELRLLLDPLELPSDWTQPPARIEATIRRTGPDTITWSSPSTFAGVELRAFEVTTPAGRMKLVYDLGTAGGKVSGSFDPDAIAFEIDDVDLKRLPPWIRELAGKPAAIPAEGLLDASGTFRSWATDARALAVNVNAARLVWAGIAIDPLVAAVSWSGSRVEIASVRAGAPGGASITAEGIVLDFDDDLVLTAANEVRAEGPDLAACAAGARLVQRGDAMPAGIAFTVVAGRREKAGIAISKLEVANAELAASASGSFEPSGRWDDWKAFPLVATVTARTKTPQRRTVREDLAVEAAALTLAAEVRGTLGVPRGTFTIEGGGATVLGEPLTRARAEGSVEWPVVAVTRLDAATADTALLASGRIDVERREVRDAGFELALTGPALLRRLLPDLPAVSGRLEARGTVEQASAEGARLAVTISGRGIRSGKIDVSSLEGAVRVDGRAVAIERIRASGAHGEVEVTGTATLEEPVAAAAELDVVARVPDAARLADFHEGLARLRGDVRVRGRLTKAAGVPLERTAWTGTVSAESVAMDAWTIGTVSAKTAVTWPALAVSDIEASGPFGRATGSADLDLAAGTLTRAAIDVDAAVDLASMPKVAGAPPLAGNLRAQGRVEKHPGDDWRAWRGDLRLASDELTVSGQPIRAFSADVGSDGATISVRHVRGRHAAAALAVSGALVPGDGGVRVRIDTIEATRDDGKSLALAQPAELRWRPGTFEAGRFELSGLGGRIAGRASIGERVDVEIEARALELGAVIPDASGQVDGTITASGAPEQLEIQGRVDAPAVVFRGRKVSVASSFAQTGGVLTVDRLHVDAGDLLVLEGKGRLPAVSLAGGRVAFGPVESAEFSLEGRSSGGSTWTELGFATPSQLSDLVIGVEARGRELEVRATADLAVRRTRDEAPREVPVTVDAKLGPGGARITGRAGTAEDTLAHAELLSDLAYDWTDLSRWTGPGGEIEGRLDFEADDAAPIAPFIPGLRHLGGRVRVHAEVAGTVAEPRFSGHADIDGFSIRFEAEVPGIDDLVARVRLEGGEILIDQLEGRIGHGPFRVTGKVTVADLRDPVFDVSIEGDRVQLARSDGLRLRADLRTRLEGRLGALKISGTTRITDAVFSQAMAPAGGAPGPSGGATSADLLFRFRDPPLSTATFDLVVTADKTLRVDNNLVSAVLSADIRLAGRGQAPRLEGRITTDRARLRLPLTRLDVERAEILFQEQDQYQPRVDAVAWTRIAGYELTVIAGGVLPDVNLRVASLPPLTQRDAYLLITTGITPGELARQGVARAAVNRASSVYGTQLLSSFSGSRDQSTLDRYSLEIGREQTARGSPTIDVEVPLSERFYLHGERDRFDDYNAGIIWRLRLK